MSDKLDLPPLHQPSGDSDNDDGAPFLFRAFKIEEINSEDSLTPTAREDFGIPNCQPSDDSMTQTSESSTRSFQHSSDSNSDDDAEEDDQKKPAAEEDDKKKPAARLVTMCVHQFPDYQDKVIVSCTAEETAACKDRLERANMMLEMLEEEEGCPVYRYSKKHLVYKNSDTDLTSDSSISSASSTPKKAAN
jgi:hypothetical protein